MVKIVGTLDPSRNVRWEQAKGEKSKFRDLTDAHRIGGSITIRVIKWASDPDEINIRG